VGGDDAVGFLLEGLTILRNRGYDSAGVASVGVRSDSVAGTDLVVTKYASRDSTCDSIDLVRAHASKHIGKSHVIQIKFNLIFQ
jgi:glutamine---fructose-6-phosphate transaminase (isomerizing)